jgi:FKBP-type peptidyl-prolyl cis-trans isomerase FklB
MVFGACKPTQTVVVEEPKEELVKFVQMENQKDSLSYALGLILHGNMKKGGFEGLNYEVMYRAMLEADTGSAQMKLPEANVIVQSYQEKVREQQQKAQAAAGKKFLEENAKKEGVKVTASGLQYKVLTAGKGEKPLATNEVTVHYEGRLIDGTVFDSSYKRGQTISFPLNGVIKGWTEGLQLMSPGAKYEFYIPYNLGYGERGAGQQIPPYATLIFVVELFSFK